jgi:hypothetical protein
MGMCSDRSNVPQEVSMKVLAMMNSIHSFVSGEAFFRSMLNIPRDEYIISAKKTIKFFLIPAFTNP